MSEMSCKQPVRRNTVTEYAADMNVLLTYYKCRDDWEDEKKVTALGYSKVLQGKVKKLDQKYPDKSRRIQKLLSELSEMEKSGEKDIDKMAGCFGKIMEEIFAWKQDVWEDTLRRMGFFLGKFIYLLDAYDDVEEDIKNKNYNPFSEQYIIEGFDEQVRRILIMMMAQTCREFEKLPIIKYTDILRNILYSGVWCRFEVIHKKGQWYYLSSMANMGLGNNVNALNDIKQAIRLEPDNVQYQMVLQQMEGGGNWYQEMQNPFGGMPTGGDDYCMKLCLANMACSLCCPGSGIFCC